MPALETATETGGNVTLASAKKNENEHSEVKASAPSIRAATGTAALIKRSVPEVRVGGAKSKLVTSGATATEHSEV